MTICIISLRTVLALIIYSSSVSEILDLVGAFFRAVGKGLMVAFIKMQFKDPLSMQRWCKSARGGYFCMHCPRPYAVDACVRQRHACRFFQKLQAPLLGEGLFELQRGVEGHLGHKVTCSTHLESQRLACNYTVLAQNIGFSCRSCRDC